MSEYYELIDSMTPTRWHLGEVKRGDGSEVWLDLCRRVERPDGLSVEVTNPGRVLEYCTTSFNAPVATLALADAIQELAGEAVECLPVTIGGQQGFELVNALREVRCIDEARSEYLKWTEQDGRRDKTGRYRQVSRLVVDPVIVPEGLHIFRPWGWTVVLIVSEKLRATMERVGCSGAEFHELMPR